MKNEFTALSHRLQEAKKACFRACFVDPFRGWRPSEILWLVFCLASIVALSLYTKDTPLGLAAAATGMLYTVLAGKGKAVCFLFGLVNTPLYAYLACKAGYYGDFVLNIYYFAMMFPGLVAFLRHRAEDDEESIRRTRLSRKGRTVLVLFSAAGTLALGAVLSALGGTRPFCDAATNILSVAAMYLTVRRALEQWVLWIAVDVLEVFMWAKIYAAGESHISILMMWLLFLANGIYLLAMWLRIEARKTASVNAPPARFRQAGAPHP